MSAILIAAGAVIAIAGRHTVAGIVIGCGMMFVGWIWIERKEDLMHE